MRRSDPDSLPKRPRYCGHVLSLKKYGSHAAAVPRVTWKKLEADMRPERDAQIVERPVIHIDLIAHIQT